MASSLAVRCCRRSAMSTSSSVSHPLVDFLDLLHRRSVSAAVRSLSSTGQSASLHSVVDPTRHSELLAPLTWRWFVGQWLSSGCRLLPLLAAHLQSAVVQSSNSACAPPSCHSAGLAALYRSQSWPRPVMAAHTADCFDTVTARLSQWPAPSHVARRVHIYYTLYCLHGCQVTVERCPIPLTRHHWQLLLDDLSALQQLPVLEPYAVLRDMLQRQSVDSHPITRLTRSLAQHSAMPHRLSSAR